MSNRQKTDGGSNPCKEFESESFAEENVSEADAAVWQKAIEGVKPIFSSHIVPNRLNKISRRIEKYQTVPLKFYQHNLELGSSSDIDGSTMRRFKREEFPVEGVLDLHGYNEAQAFEAVRRFITDSYIARKRCVIIVTGKGIKHPDEDIFAPKGILKERVPQWLQGEEIRQLILTYIHPSERLGGKGALYILLRRRRG